MQLHPANEMSLQSNAVSYWLGANLDSTLFYEVLEIETKANKLQQSIGKIEITVNETEAQFPHNKPFLTWPNLDPISSRET